MRKIAAYILIAAVLGGGAIGGFLWQRERALSDQVGQMILVGFRGMDAKDSEVRALAHEIRRGHVGGIILFNVDLTNNSGPRNIRDLTQVRELNAYLQSAARIPLFVSVDQEGGAVNRLTPAAGFEITESAEQLGRENPGHTRAAAADLGRRMRTLGFNLDFAPSVDLAINPDNPIIAKRGRAFGRDAATVIAHGRAFADGLNDADMLFAFKHFPGHGSAGGDTHAGLVDVTDVFQDTELDPYRALARTDMMGMVMVAHVFNRHIDPKFPASLSRKTIDILRRDIGYDGVVITDGLSMGAIVQEFTQPEVIRHAIDAGADILLMGDIDGEYVPNIAAKTHATVMKMVHSGVISRARVQQSYDRIMKLKEKIK